MKELVAGTIHRGTATNHILQTRLCKINKCACVFEFFACMFYIMHVTSKMQALCLTLYIVPEKIVYHEIS